VNTIPYDVWSFCPRENEKVTKEFSGGGDPKRSIELLWGRQEPPARGPKPRLTVLEITRAAI